MARSRRREELLRLLDDIEQIGERPAGPHLDEEDLIALADGSLGDREAHVFEHLQSCAECLENAANVPDVLEAAADARRAVAAAAAAAARRVAGLVWMVATMAVWAHHHKLKIVPLNTSADDSDRRAASKFEWAIGESGGERFLEVRTRGEQWRPRPVHCVVYDTRSDRNVAESWVMVYARDDEGYAYGETVLRTAAPTSQDWKVEVREYGSFEELPPERANALQQAFSAGLTADEGRAWEAWLEGEISDGKLTPQQVSAITGRHA